MAFDSDFLRLQEPVAIRVTPPSGASLALEGIAVSLSGLILHGLPGAYSPGTRLDIELALPRGPIRVQGRVGLPTDSPGETRVHFESISGAELSALESFITRVRKEDHLRLCLGDGVGFREVTSGFERYRLPHSALPEADLREIDLSTTFLGKRLRLPLLVSSMTGGSELAKRVNRNLARASQERGIALGLGSMRILLIDPSLLDTFAVRELAPDTLLLANLGAVQLNYGVGLAECERLIEMVGADAFILHFNPLQEAVQPEGDTRFAGLEARLGEIVPRLSVPTVAKEVGAGISGTVAGRLVACGFRAIDVAGASGTSWSRIEGKRARSGISARLGETFGDWGVPTARCLVECRKSVPGTPLVASGGIRSGLEGAKAIALGASLVGIARPFLEAAADSAERVLDRIDEFAQELRVAMFVTGARTIEELGGVRATRVDED